MNNASRSDYTRKYCGDSFKLKVALTAVKGTKSTIEMIKEFGIAANQICAWKKQLEEHGACVFADKRRFGYQIEEFERLHAVIGKLTVECYDLKRALERIK
jgi:transposase-like protein